MLLAQNFYLKNNSVLKSRKEFLTIALFLFLLVLFGTFVNTRFFIIGVVFYIVFLSILLLLSRKNILLRNNISSYYILSVFFFCALCIYAHAALLAFAFPVFLLFSQTEYKNKYKIIINYLSLLLVTLFLYFLILKSFTLIENINSVSGRSIMIDFDVVRKLTFYFKDVLPHAFSLWRIDKSYSLASSIILALSLIGCFIFFFKKKTFKTSFINIFIIFFTLFLTIGPVIFIKDNYFAPYRSMIGHTFILYFIPLCLFFNLLIKFRFGSITYTLVFFGYILFYGHWPNKIINDNVIKPTEKELKFINDQFVKNNIIEKIKNGEKIKIFLNRLSTHSVENNLIQDMHVLAATGSNGVWIPEIIYGLLYSKHDIKYNLERRNLNEKIMYKNADGKRVLCVSVSLPLGDIVYSNDIKIFQDNNSINMNSIVIDMNKMER